jgi:hypothetical protein
MPLLLRRAAPSPSVDQLSFQTPATSLTSLAEANAQKCPIHGSAAVSRASSGSRRRSLNGFDTENSSGSSSEERDSREESLAATAAAAAAEVDAERASGGSAKSSFCCTCTAAGPVRTRASQGSSKRISTRLEDLSVDAESVDDVGYADTDDNESVCCSHDADATCYKCEVASASGERESISSSTSSRVVIRDTQLAALDVEIQNLRKTFVRSMYTRLTTMSKRLSKREGTKQITAA